MLIFPEGTCVNNDFAIMFKKGASAATIGIITPQTPSCLRSLALSVSFFIHLHRFLRLHQARST